jgi:hypothetical protein
MKKTGKRPYDPHPHAYGNIYTPRAGQMIIHVQRESGFLSRTIVLSERQVRLLRYVLSRTGLMILAFAILSWIVLAIQAARVPVLTQRISELERNTKRLDSLSAAVSRANLSYAQVQRMLVAVGAVGRLADSVAGKKD